MSPSPRLITTPLLGTVETRWPDDQLRALMDALRAELREQLQLTDDNLRPLNQQEAAQLLGVSVDTLIKWERNGTLVPFRDGRVVLYGRYQLFRLVNNLPIEPAASRAA